MIWDQYQNFNEDEFRCPCCGAAEMTMRFMETLQHLRVIFGRGLTISSGFRCEDHNASIGGGAPHPTGNAADIPIYGEDAHRLVTLAMPLFTGIGFKQHSMMDKRFIHLDLLEPPHPRPRIWTYA
jgi:uncharacterized protein YcbK (DUF882 family)